MIIARFSQRIVQSRMLDLYVATVFFSTTIFFILNSASYTPLEMMYSIVFVTIIAKGFANIMLAMLISLFKFDNEYEKLAFEKSAKEAELLAKELKLKSTKEHNERIIQKEKDKK
jgi:predicted histidine transporter YuiF (NhaC family)